MSPKSKDALEKHKQFKQSQILETALGLFANEGYHAASVAKIAKHAGISKGLVYTYFDSKEAILKTLVFDFFKQLMATISLEQDGALSGKEFLLMIEKNFDWIIEKREMAKLYFSLTLQPAVLSIVEANIMEMAFPFFKVMSNFFESKGCENPYAEARYLNSLLDGIFMNYVIEPDTFPLNVMKKKVLDQYAIYLD